MEARHRAAGDGDEQEREQRAGEHRAGAVDEARRRRHRERRRDDVDAERQRDDGADLEEGAQVVARREHQPHRQARGDRAVEDQRPRELRCRCSVNSGAQRRTLRRRRGRRQIESEQQHHAERRGFAHAPRADEAHVDAHQQRDRNRRRDGEQAPRARRSAPSPRPGASTARMMIMIASTPTSASEPGIGPELHLDHLAERLAVAAHRREQHDEVLHRAGDARRRPGSTACRGESPSARRAPVRPAARRPRWRRSGGP